MDLTRSAADGRDEIRRLKAVTVPGPPFPHAGQALQDRPSTAHGAHWEGLPRTRQRHSPASPPPPGKYAADLAGRVRGHWAIERS